MLMISWNCQGVGRPLIVSNIRELIKVHRPALVFLMKTKNKSENLERIRKKTSLDNFFYVDPVGISGGLALWWHNSLQLSVNSSDSNLITTTIQHHQFGAWDSFFVYGPTLAVSRQALWHRVSVILNATKRPHACSYRRS